MRVLVIPDIHLETDKVDKIIKSETFDRVVMLGDYFDDFGDTPEQNEEVARWVMKMVKRKNFTLLLGNHDMAYYGSSLGSDKFLCSGFSYEKSLLINKHMDWSKLKTHFFADKILYTHAGLNNSFVHRSWSKISHIKKFLKENDDRLKEWTKNVKNARGLELFNSSRIRGGTQSVGGITWNDFREHEPIPFLRQIFGHTRRDGFIREKGNDFCIDTGLQHYAIVEDGLVQICNI